MATITHLFLKKAKGKAMMPAASIVALKGQGIAGDVNANAISPRQVLITNKQDLDDLVIPYGGLRENIIVAGLDREAFKPGALLGIGEQVKIRLTFHCEPCKIIAGVVPDLAVVVHKRGILGVVIAGGTITVGDRVTCQRDQYEAFSATPYERFLNFMQHVPPGKVVTYKMVAQGMGVAEGYLRAMPAYIKKALRDQPDLPVHRMVNNSGITIEEQVPHQLQLLKAENVEVLQERSLFPRLDVHRVPLDQYLWKGESLYLE